MQNDETKKKGRITLLENFFFTSIGNRYVAKYRTARSKFPPLVDVELCDSLLQRVFRGSDVHRLTPSSLRPLLHTSFLEWFPFCTFQTRLENEPLLVHFRRQIQLIAVELASFIAGKFAGRHRVARESFTMKLSQ